MKVKLLFSLGLIFISLFFPIALSLICSFTFFSLFLWKPNKIYFRFSSLFIIANQVTFWASRSVMETPSDDIGNNYNFYNDCKNNFKSCFSGENFLEPIVPLINLILPSGLEVNALLMVYLLLFGIAVFFVLEFFTRDKKELTLGFIILMFFLASNSTFVASQLTRQSLGLIFMALALVISSKRSLIGSFFIHVSTIVSFFFYNYFNKFNFNKFISLCFILIPLSIIGFSSILEVVLKLGSSSILYEKILFSSNTGDSFEISIIKYLIFIFFISLISYVIKDYKIILIIPALLLVELFFGEFSLLYRRIFLMFDGFFFLFIVLYLVSFRTNLSNNYYKKVNRHSRYILLAPASIGIYFLLKRVIVDSQDLLNFFRPLHKYNMFDIPILSLIN